MTLGSGTSDGQPITINNFGNGTATVTLNVQGASTAFTLVTGSVLNIRWNVANSTWLLVATNPSIPLTIVSNAVAGCIIIYDLTVLQGSTNITSASRNFKTSDVGKTILYYNQTTNTRGGIATIVSVNNIIAPLFQMLLQYPSHLDKLDLQYLVMINLTK